MFYSAGPFKTTLFKCPILNAYDCNCVARCKSCDFDGICEPVILWLACQRGSGLSCCCCCWTHQIWERFGSFVTTSLLLFLSNSLGIGREITGQSFSLETIKGCRYRSRILQLFFISSVFTVYFIKMNIKNLSLTSNICFWDKRKYLLIAASIFHFSGLLKINIKDPSLNQKV